MIGVHSFGGTMNIFGTMRLQFLLLLLVICIHSGRAQEEFEGSGDIVDDFKGNLISDEGSGEEHTLSDEFGESLLIVKSTVAPPLGDDRNKQNNDTIETHNAVLLSSDPLDSIIHINENTESIATKARDVSSASTSTVPVILRTTAPKPSEEHNLTTESKDDLPQSSDIVGTNITQLTTSENSDSILTNILPVTPSVLLLETNATSINDILTKTSRSPISVTSEKTPGEAPVPPPSLSHTDSKATLSTEEVIRTPSFVTHSGILGKSTNGAPSLTQSVTLSNSSTSVKPDLPITTSTTPSPDPATNAPSVTEVHLTITNASVNTIVQPIITVQPHTDATTTEAVTTTAQSRETTQSNDPSSATPNGPPSPAKLVAVKSTSDPNILSLTTTTQHTTELLTLATTTDIPEGSRLNASSVLTSINKEEEFSDVSDFSKDTNSTIITTRINDNQSILNTIGTPFGIPTNISLSSGGLELLIDAGEELLESDTIATVHNSEDSDESDSPGATNTELVEEELLNVHSTTENKTATEEKEKEEEDTLITNLQSIDRVKLPSEATHAPVNVPPTSTGSIDVAQVHHEDQELAANDTLSIVDDNVRKAGAEITNIENNIVTNIDKEESSVIVDGSTETSVDDIIESKNQNEEHSDKNEEKHGNTHATLLPVAVNNSPLLDNTTVLTLDGNADVITDTGSNTNLLAVNTAIDSEGHRSEETDNSNGEESSLKRPTAPNVDSGPTDETLEQGQQSTISTAGVESLELEHDGKKLTTQNHQGGGTDGKFERPGAPNNNQETADTNDESNGQQSFNIIDEDDSTAIDNSHTRSSQNVVAITTLTPTDTPVETHKVVTVSIDGLLLPSQHYKNDMARNTSANFLVIRNYIMRQLRPILRNYYKNKLLGLTVTRLRPGSVIVDFELQLRELISAPVDVIELEVLEVIKDAIKYGAFSGEVDGTFLRISETNKHNVNTASTQHEDGGVDDDEEPYEGSDETEQTASPDDADEDSTEHSPGKPPSVGRSGEHYTGSDTVDSIPDESEDSSAGDDDRDYIGIDDDDYYDYFDIVDGSEKQVIFNGYEDNEEVNKHQTGADSNPDTQTDTPDVGNKDATYQPQTHDQHTTDTTSPSVNKVDDASLKNGHEAEPTTEPEANDAATTTLQFTTEGRVLTRSPELQEQWEKHWINEQLGLLKTTSGDDMNEIESTTNSITTEVEPETTIPEELWSSTVEPEELWSSTTEPEGEMRYPEIPGSTPEGEVSTTTNSDWSNKPQELESDVEHNQEYQPEIVHVPDWEAEGNTEHPEEDDEQGEETDDTTTLTPEGTPNTEMEEIELNAEPKIESETEEMPEIQHITEEWPEIQPETEERPEIQLETEKWLELEHWNEPEPTPQDIDVEGSQEHTTDREQWMEPESEIGQHQNPYPEYQPQIPTTESWLETSQSSEEPTGSEPIQDPWHEQKSSDRWPETDPEGEHRVQQEVTPESKHGNDQNNQRESEWTEHQQLPDQAGGVESEPWSEPNVQPGDSTENQLDNEHPPSTNSWQESDGHGNDGRQETNDRNNLYISQLPEAGSDNQATNWPGMPSEIDNVPVHPWTENEQLSSSATTLWPVHTSKEITEDSEDWPELSPETEPREEYVYEEHYGEVRDSYPDASDDNQDQYIYDEEKRNENLGTNSETHRNQEGRSGQNSTAHIDSSELEDQNRLSPHLQHNISTPDLPRSSRNQTLKEVFQTFDRRFNSRDNASDNNSTDAGFNSSGDSDRLSSAEVGLIALGCVTAVLLSVFIFTLVYYRYKENELNGDWKTERYSDSEETGSEHMNTYRSSWFGPQPSYNMGVFHQLPRLYWMKRNDIDSTPTIGYSYTYGGYSPSETKKPFPSPPQTTSNRSDEFEWHAKP